MREVRGQLHADHLIDRSPRLGLSLLDPEVAEARRSSARGRQSGRVRSRGNPPDDGVSVGGATIPGGRSKTRILGWTPPSACVPQSVVLLIVFRPPTPLQLRSPQDYMNQFRVLDLFSGCGGISWGFKKAGFQILAGVDQDKEALETFALNMPEACALNHDLSGDGVAKLASILGIEPGEIDVLVGGPPCQGFSKNVTRSGRFLEDPKNLLVRSFMDAVETLSPRIVLMENVATMANAFGGAFRDELLQRFADCGYDVRYGTHNAAEHGLPQRRNRVVFLASRLGLTQPLVRQARVPSQSGTHKSSEIPAGAISVWDAIGDLGRVDPAGGADESNKYCCEPFSPFQELMRANNVPLTDHSLRPLRSKQQARYDALEPGQGLPDLPAELKTKGGYSGAYGRLTKTMIAPTITRWCFHPGSGRFGHPVERRILTIREAARLQGFSDDFRFSGSNHKKSWQVGNAVPPVLARAFAERIAAVLGGSSAWVPRQGDLFSRSRATPTASQGAAKR